MDLSDVVLNFSETYQVSRRPQGSYVSGRFVEGEPETLFISACVQPASGRQLQRLPDGMRKSEVIAIWTTERLYVKTDSQNPDLLIVGEDSYEVQLVKPWDVLGGYFEALAVKV